MRLLILELPHSSQPLCGCQMHSSSVTHSWAETTDSPPRTVSVQTWQANLSRHQRQTRSLESPRITRERSRETPTPSTTHIPSRNKTQTYVCAYHWQQTGAQIPLRRAWYGNLTIKTHAGPSSTHTLPSPVHTDAALSSFNR